MFANKLANVKFNGFRNLNWSRIFLRLQIKYECGLYDSFLFSFTFFIKAFISRKDTISLQENKHSKILSYINEKRESYHKHNSLVTDLLDIDILSGHRDNKININIIDGIKLTYYIIVWFWQMRKTNISLRIKGVIISYLTLLWKLQKDINKCIDFKKYNLLITFNDSLIDSAFLIELFRNHKIKTATLQHGQFTSKRENVFENSGVEYISSSSDYFLCWNKFTFDEAIKSGINKNKLVIVGILEYIGKKREKCTPPNNNTFGVVLGHPMYEKQNIELIKSANILSKTYNLRYYLKLHPNYNENHFNYLVEKNHYLGNITKGIDILQYANSVDFSLICSSSVFVELIYVNHNIIRLSNGDIKDKFRDIKIGKYYQKAEHILDIYKKELSNNYSEELFDYLCSVDDVTAKYIDFLKQFT